MTKIVIPPRCCASNGNQIVSGSKRPCSPPIEFIMPAGLNMTEVLSQKLWMNADDGRYVVSCTLFAQVTRRTDQDGFARLNFNTLSDIVPRGRIAPLMRELEQQHVLERDHSYGAGRYSKGCRLTDRYMQAPPVRVRPTSPRLIDRLRQHQRRIAGIQARRRKPIHGRLDEIQRDFLSIDAAEARRIIAAELKPSARLSQLVLVENLERARCTSSVSSTGRYFNAITGVSKRIRPAVYIDGEHLGAVDLTCCQPALLGMLIHFLTPEGWKGAYTYKMPLSPRVRRRLSSCLLDVPGDMGLFRDLVSNGSFFEELVRLLGLSTGDATAKRFVKHRFFVDVLARKHQYPSDVRTVFEEQFPGVATFIRAVNAEDYRCLIRLLQRLEAWLVVETVAPRLVDKVPIVTLHDAVYCRDREADLTLVEQAFGEVFNDIGFNISTKREHYSPPGTTSSTATNTWTSEESTLAA